MNWSDLPSLNSLRAFYTVADTGSYTEAAKRLNVTHAAVNQQVKSLEARLDTQLVIRRGRGIALTDEGTALAGDLRIGFAAIHTGVEKFLEISNSQPVQISTSPAFAVEWLMPRIQEFQQLHPEITLLLNPTADVVELKPGGIDLAIRYRSSNTLEQEIEPLLVSDMVVVGKRSLIGGNETSKPTDLLELPWLQELGTTEVSDWFKRNGIVKVELLKITQMPGNLIMSALRQGDGISYTARAFFKEEIGAGEMVVLDSESASGSYVIETGAEVMRPAVKSFVNWLKSKADSEAIDTGKR